MHLKNLEMDTYYFVRIIDRLSKMRILIISKYMICNSFKQLLDS